VMNKPVPLTGNCLIKTDHPCGQRVNMATRRFGRSVELTCQIGPLEL
jgi:hypothetical protein